MISQRWQDHDALHSGRNGRSVTALARMGKGMAVSCLHLCIRHSAFPFQNANCHSAFAAPAEHRNRLEQSPPNCE